MGCDSSVSIATGYGLDGPGIESGRRRDFPHLSRPALGPTNLLYSEYWACPGVKERPGRDPDTSPLLVPWSRKSRAISLPLWSVGPVQNLSALYRTPRGQYGIRASKLHKNRFLQNPVLRSLNPAFLNHIVLHNECS